MKRIALFVIMVLALVGCSDAAVVSENISTAADQFEIDRRIIFYNGITDTYMFTIEGKCSIEVEAMESQLEVVCLVGPNEYKKHFLGLSDNVTYFVEQTAEVKASQYRYRVVFKPSVIVPDPELG